MLRLIKTISLLAVHLGSYSQDVALPDGRTSALLIHDPLQQSMLLFDGYQIHLDSTRNDVWAWDGKTWKRIKAFGPGSRSLSAGGLNTDTKAITIFGGLGKGNYENKKDDVWSFKDNQWTKINRNSIGSRDHHEMVYADQIKSFVLYGGLDSSRIYDSTTWLFKNNHFTALDIPGPGVRYHFAMAYDPVRKKVVLYGGGKEDRRDELWEFDGKKWMKMHQGPVNPGKKISHSMAYHNDLKMTILHGGDESNATWGWNGLSWTRIAQDGPTGQLIALGYDPRRKVMISYGGSGSGNLLFSETWELNGSRWTKISDNGQWQWKNGKFQRVGNQ